jgi:hypothetical protein
LPAHAASWYSKDEAMTGQDILTARDPNARIHLPAAFPMIMVFTP